ncbi:hypothetical protein A8E81_35800 [Burkholderia cenocepacia]|nr:hypothetical protein A8E75_00185 [Burkholderia cenocepacia]ONV22025.1 hypothetical protein A8E74_17820 [Burkholderia cenocepacia]ONV26994.1 hypothetical protein A8E77_25370 [Burkholderia cenocepacia]ONV34835.1 hypothetical protein A8E78_09775 [Burkholderia cenocepacia]ONV41557.1 hypothetical protein A8E82_17795 [Burkholderia cenocepacia]
MHVALAPTDRQHTFASTRSVRCITQRRTPQHVETSAAASGARPRRPGRSTQSDAAFTSSRKISPSADGSRISSPLNGGDAFPLR